MIDIKGKWTPVLAVVAYVLASFFLVRYAVPFFLPFVLSVALALSIESPVRWITKQTKISRGLAVFIVLIAVCAVLGTFLGIGIARLVGELVRFSVSLPAYYYRASVFLEELANKMSEITASLPAPIQNMIEQQVGRIFVGVEAIVRTVLETFKGLPNVAGIVLISLIATFFISRDREMLIRLVAKLLPGMANDKFTKARHEVIKSTVGLLKAQFALVIVTTVIVIVALWLMGCDYALALGLLIGLFDILPVIGPGLIFVPWAIYAALFGSVTRAILLMVLYGSTSTVRQMIQPKLIGDTVGLHPLATLFAIYLGLKLFGVVGILIGPLLAVVFKAFVGAGIIPTWNSGGKPS